MHLIGVVILLLIASAVLSRTVSRAREAHRGYSASGMPGPRPPRARAGSLRMPGTGWLEHRRKIGLEKLRHEHGLIRDSARHRRGLISEWARHRMRMEQRAADWERRAPAREAPSPRKSAPEAGTAGSAPEPPPGPDGSRPEPVVVTGIVIRPGEDRAPETTAAPPPPTATTTVPQPEGTDMSNQGVEQAVDGMHLVHATAAAGNIRAKQWAIKGCAELFTRAAALMLMLSRTLAERGYGPEISEPLARAGVMAQAAATACGESDTAITTLANMTVGELADSPRQAPERSELSETGAH